MIRYAGVSRALAEIVVFIHAVSPALRAHLITGDGGLVVQGNPGSELWRPTCNL